MTARRRKVNPYSSWEVQAYVLECYAGVEEMPDRVVPLRQFIWEEADGSIWIGNSTAFAEHVARRFSFPALPYDFWHVNNILLQAGERIRPRTSRTPRGRTGPYIPEPSARQVQRRESVDDGEGDGEEADGAAK